MGFAWLACSADSDSSDDEFEYQALRGISEVGEFRNWGVTVQTAPAKVLRPKSVKDVLQVLKKVGGSIGPSWGCVRTALDALSPLTESSVLMDKTRRLYARVREVRV